MIKNEEWQHSGLVFVKPVTMETMAWILSFLTPTSGQHINQNNCNLNRIRYVEYFIERCWKQTYQTGCIDKNSPYKMFRKNM